jgi:hypothetical protein
MSEFVDRMSAQRTVLQVVNAKAWREDLFGLSSQAIDRWLEKNGVNPESELAALLRSTSERLRFLASKSQMHLLDDYREVSCDIRALTNEIRGIIG